MNHMGGRKKLFRQNVLQAESAHDSLGDQSFEKDIPVKKDQE